MKISNYSATEMAARIYQGQSGGTARQQRERGVSRRFDSVTLSGESKRSAYEMELRGRLSQEVRTATSSGQVAALREQVQNGTYRADARETARRMLLAGGF